VPIAVQVLCLVRVCVGIMGSVTPLQLRVNVRMVGRDRDVILSIQDVPTTVVGMALVFQNSVLAGRAGTERIVLKSSALKVK